MSAFSGRILKASNAGHPSLAALGGLGPVPPIHPFTCYQPHVSLGTGQAACTVHSGKASAPSALNLKVSCVILSNLCDFSEPQFTHL